MILHNKTKIDESDFALKKNIFENGMVNIEVF
jgi:hypothetical protein